MKNINKISEEILKLSVDISIVDPKIQNRIMQVKKIYQKIHEIEKTIEEEVGSLQEEIKILERQTKIFEKELIPVLKELSDHAIKTEGFFIELKSGKRSPKVGYEYLASKVTSELLLAAEEAIAQAAIFAHSISVKVSSKEKIQKSSGVLDWLTKQWSNLVSFVEKLKNRSNTIKKLLFELEK